MIEAVGYQVPRDNVERIFPDDVAKSEMSWYESGFICGLIKKYEPKKILELGVAAGVSSAIIIECLENLAIDATLYSVDIADAYYRDGKQKTGYFLDLYTKQKTLKHTKHIKKIPVDIESCIEEIGSDIDFVILDTCHQLPGECMDFLVVLPFLANNAIVCLHDIALNQYSPIKQAVATNVLFHTVKANKIFSFLPSLPEHLSLYPNVAAFQIKRETMENIIDVFLALTLSWNYLPDWDYIARCRALFRRFYGVNECKIFDEAVLMNFISYYPVIKTIPLGTKLAVYGTGNLGKYFSKCINMSFGIIRNIKITVFFDKNWSNIEAQDGIEVVSPEEITGREFDAIVIAIADLQEVERIYSALAKHISADRILALKHVC